MCYDCSLLYTICTCPCMQSSIITLFQVDLCFLVDCTGSMARHIEAVKNCVTKLRDNLVQQHKGCDIQFAFVRYTDYDMGNDRTTCLPFTRQIKQLRNNTVYIAQVLFFLFLQ